MSTIRSYALLANWTLHYPFTMLSVIVVLAVLATNYTVNNLEIDTDTAKLIAPDAPFQQYRRLYERAFSQDFSTLLLVVESPATELTKSAARKLASVLRNDTTHFNSVYLPYDNGFFR